MDVDDARNLQRFQREKKKAEAKNKLTEVAEFCNCIGEIYSKYGQYEEAIQEHSQELHLGEALGDKIGEAVACRKIGECHCFLGQYEEALRLQKRHLVLARECGNSLEEQRAWATIGKTYFCQSESRNLVTSAAASKKAEKAYTRALEACEKVKSSVKVEEYMAMKGRLYLNIGLVYDARSEVKLCTDVMKRAVAIAEKFKLHDELYLCHQSLATVHQKCGQSTQALRSADLALRLAEKLRNKVGEKEMYIQKAQIHANVGDYLAAKHCLKKAHKMKVLSDTGQGKLVKMFRCVNKMQDATLDLETVSDERRMAELNESLADCSAELGNFSEAVQHYLATLQSENLLSNEKRADIYVSLAQTYADLRKYEEAIFYYRKELEERKDNQEQSCRTQLNIAELEELRGSKYPVMCKIYMSAYEAARKAKHVKLQVQTLKDLVALQKACSQSEHLRETERKLESVMKKYDVSDSQIISSDDDDDNDHTSDKDHDDQEEVSATRTRKEDDDGGLSLSDLTLSDESGNDDMDVAKAPSRPKKTKLARRNEKGETPLHRACIDGNLKKAKTLIAQGHPINPRDFCGWLPLHEACNHGHTELARCLLDAGAWINDRGGERCGGVTPLIDAANCGNLAIVRLLVERGANLHAKDDDGNTAVDCLHSWYQRARDTLGASDVLEYNTTETLLQARGGKSSAPGCSSNSSSSLPSQAATATSGSTFRERLGILRQRKMNKKDSSPERKRKAKRGAKDLTSSSDDLSDCDPLPLPLPNLSSKLGNGVDEYCAAIETIGSSVQKRFDSELALEKDKEEDRSFSSLPALLDAREDVGDDWLVNDVGAVKSKRKNNPQADRIFNTFSTRHTGKKRTRVEEKAVSEKRSKLVRNENMPSISSSEDVLNRDAPERLLTISSGRSSSVLSRPELFDDHSSNDACPVTSSTERLDDVPPVQSPTKDRNKSVDTWDSDEELLSHMDYLGDSFGELDSIASPSQPDKTIVREPQTSAVVKRPGDFRNDRQSMLGSVNTSQSVISKEESKSRKPYSLDRLLSEKNNGSNPEEFHHTNSSSNAQSQASRRTGSAVSSDMPPRPLQRLQQHSTQPLQQQPPPNQQPQQHQQKQLPPPHEPPYQKLQQQQLAPSQPAEMFSYGVRPLRIKVKIAEQTLLVPIPTADQQRPVLWLCQQAGQRYFNMFLVRPLLTLTTSDGSVLSPSDTISSVLAEDETLTAVVRSWERPRLEERYLQACTLCLVEEPSRPALSALGDCETSGVLSLCDLGFGSASLQPVFQAIEGQRTLTELRLAGNRLGDSGIGPLMEMLAGLPILKVLSLDSNGLSAEGLRTIASVLKQKAANPDSVDHCLSTLTSLSLGHNSLEDLAGPPLAAVVTHLPRLARLDLPACGFTEAVFTKQFCTALQGRRLQHLSIAENPIKTEGISLLLSSLHSECLQGLDISHTRPVTDNKNLLPMLESFTGSDECCLAELSLAGCQLTDSDVLAVNRLILNVGSLTTLSLSQNKSVTNKSLQKLLALAAGEGCSLESLTARGCSLSSPLGSELVESLRGKMGSKVPLVKLVFSCRGLKQDEASDVKAVWTGRWKDRAQSKVLGVAVSLTVSERT